jgi:hypothetical protein
VEDACSKVAATDKLLREAMAMDGRDTLHPIWVSLEKKNSLPEFLWLLWVPLYSLASASAPLGLGYY